MGALGAQQPPGGQLCPGSARGHVPTAQKTDAHPPQPPPPRRIRRWPGTSLRYEAHQRCSNFLISGTGGAFRSAGGVRRGFLGPTETAAAHRRPLSSVFPCSCRTLPLHNAQPTPIRFASTVREGRKLRHSHRSSQKEGQGRGWGVNQTRTWHRHAQGTGTACVYEQGHCTAAVVCTNQQNQQVASITRGITRP